jgi:hypothetical protein
LSDKKGYHGSLPVPSATLHACGVQYCGALTLPSSAKAVLREAGHSQIGKLVNENGAPVRMKMRTLILLKFRYDPEYPGP